MKTLGTTIEGNFIVEMSAEEHWSFAKVEASINGGGFDIFASQRSVSLNGKNLAPIFHALDDLFQAKISINTLKEYVNFLDRILGGDARL
jgi:hypothetical protein